MADAQRLADLAVGPAFDQQQEDLAFTSGEGRPCSLRSSRLRVAGQRKRIGYADPELEGNEDPSEAMNHLRASLDELDERISPLAKIAGEINNSRWGLLLRAGNDKNLFARQLERYADVYTSRVSNFLRATPYLFLRAPRGTLPHDD